MVRKCSERVNVVSGHDHKGPVCSRPVVEGRPKAEVAETVIHQYDLRGFSNRAGLAAQSAVPNLIERTGCVMLWS